MFQNSEIEEFANFILSLKLKGTENRMRNRLVKKLQDHLKVVQEEHKELLDEYCTKDENGSYRTLEKNGKSYYDIADVKGFQIEFEELMREEFVILSDPTNQQMLFTVKDIILNCDKEFSGSEALKYEYYCEMFEEINEVTII